MSSRSSRYHNNKRKRRSRFSLAAVVDNFKFAQRRTARRERLAKAQLLAALLALLTVAALLFAWNWNMLFVSQVHVTGLHYTNLATVVRQADVGGYHVFGLDPDRLQKRVEQLPFVRRAQVSVFPAPVLRIRVVERQPVFVWQGAGSSLWVDGEGVLLPALPSAHLRLPVLIDNESALVVSMTGEKRLSAVYAGRISHLLALNPALQVLNYRVPDGFSFRWRHQTTVYLGEADNLSQQWRLLQGALNSFSNQHGGTLPSAVDVSRPDSAIVTP